MEKDLKIFKTVFSLFDPERTGYISKEDAVTIALSLQNEMKVISDALSKMKFEHQVSFGEFATLIWQIDSKKLEAPTKVTKDQKEYRLPFLAKTDNE